MQILSDPGPIPSGQLSHSFMPLGLSSSNKAAFI